MELSKKDKKAAREIIDKGLLIEFSQGLSKFDAILSDWKENKFGSRETYYKIYSGMKNFDKHIARRYDNLSGSKYLFIIAGQLVDEVIKDEDLNLLSDEVQQHVKMIADLANR